MRERERKRERGVFCNVNVTFGKPLGRRSVRTTCVIGWLGCSFRLGAGAVLPPSPPSRGEKGCRPSHEDRRLYNKASTKITLLSSMRRSSKLIEPDEGWGNTRSTAGGQKLRGHPGPVSEVGRRKYSCGTWRTGSLTCGTGSCLQV